jgi:hypothetical protein
LSRSRSPDEVDAAGSFLPWGGDIVAGVDDFPNGDGLVCLRLFAKGLEPHVSSRCLRTHSLFGNLKIRR